MTEISEYWNEAKETLPRADREQNTLTALQSMLRYVYDAVPFYRRHYDAHGFHPDSVKTLTDFTQRVPVITKQMLRDDQEESPPYGSYLGVSTNDLVRTHGSSGTSGRPTLYAFSAQDWAYTAEVMGQALYTAGVRATDCVQLSTVFSLFMGGWGSLLGTERIGATAFPIGSGETERQLELMHRVGSTVLICTPTYALHMLEVAAVLGYDAAASPLRLGIFIGEPGSSIPGTRSRLESGWGIDVRDMASTSEMTPWGTNAECAAGVGMHVMQDEVWTEVVEKDDNARLAPDGQSGGLVYTHLRRNSQPMIRFVSGDESRMTYEPCACGRTYPRLPDGVDGRLDDMLLIRGANVYPSHVQRSILEVQGCGVEFVILLTREGGMDSATVRVERDPTLDIGQSPTFDDELAARVQRKLKNDTNVTFKIEILPPNTLERAVSKAKRVDDQRAKYRPPLS